MRTIFKTVLISSALLMTVQQSQAEQMPNISGPAPIWNFGQTPIAWGDCIPVPVVPTPFGQNNLSMNQMGVNPPPMMQSFPLPSPMNQQPALLPPPSPFFGGGNANPSSIPLPLVAEIEPNVCDDSELKALQAKYDQGAAASRAKIEELTQALNDSNNQMADARVIIDDLTNKSKEEGSKNNAELLKLESQLADSISENQSLQTKLATAETNAGNQTRKINALTRSETELTALKGAYKERSAENATLKKQLADLDDSKKTLISEQSTKETQIASLTRKVNALEQSATELEALKSAYQTRNNQNADLKAKLDEAINSNKTLQSQLNTATANAGNQARKLTALSQTGPELAALKSAYKERNDENAKLKEALAKMDGEYKTLQSQLATANTNAGSQARKLTALNQTSAELTALKSAYKAKNDENVKLKKMLISLDSSNKSLQGKLSLATKDASTQARKLTVLGQSASELTAMQSAYKEKVNQNIALKSQLADLNALKESEKACRAEVSELGMKLTNTDNKRKSLLGQISKLEATASDQTRKIASLTRATTELDALKGAYKELSSKKLELTSRLSEVTADTDNDGVFDSIDECPSSPAKSKVNSIGCPLDTDKDGIADSADECPSSPLNSAVDEKGCPKIADSDNDGVADARDLCPASPANAEVNEFGCEATQNITLKGVNFDTGSARLTPDSLPIITTAANTLNENPGLNIEIAGYTDNQGLGAINKRLSQRRANTVMIQLIKDGVDANRLKAKGYGEADPVATNDTPEGRATNRRVELKISQ